MNKKQAQQEKIEELTWTYFRQRKRREAGYVVGGGVALTFVPYWVGLLMFKILGEEHMISFWFEGSKPEVISNFCIWGIGLWYLVISAGAIGCIGAVIYLIIKLNWKAAKKQAKEEVTGKKIPWYDE